VAKTSGSRNVLWCLVAVLGAACGQHLGPVANSAADLRALPENATTVRARGIDDGALPELRRLRHLRWLDLEGGVAVVPQRVTESGFLVLPDVVGKQFSKVSIACTSEVTDRALSAIADIPTLEVLVLRRCGPFGRTGLDALARCKRLRELHIEGCDQIGDEDIPALSALKQLRRLWVAGTGVSGSGVEQLRRALPNAEISDDPVMWRANDPAPAGWKPDGARGVTLPKK
jgi:hypothetical protein